MEGFLPMAQVAIFKNIDQVRKDLNYSCLFCATN